MSNTRISGLEVKDVVAISADSEFIPQSAYETFKERFASFPSVGYGAPTGTAGDTNFLKTQFGYFEYHIKGTQTIVAPTFSGPGMNIGMDQTDNDGVEITNGNVNSSRTAFTIGDVAFSGEITINIADVSGTDDCCFGFRKVQTYQANVDDYTDACFLNVNAGTINLETILNNGATVTTATGRTVADGVDVKLRIDVETDGSTRIFVNDTEVLTTNTFTFDTGDVVIPFLFFLHSTDVAGVVNVFEWKVVTKNLPINQD